MKPIYIHSGMVGAPQYANANDSINGILEACLVNGFNSKTATSASASGGVLTLNFGANPGFEALQTVEVAVSSVAMVNGQHRVIANASNQVTIAIPGLPDGVVGSSGAGITIKQAGAGWSKPFSASTKAVFRPPAGNRRYLRVEHAVGVDFKARGYEDMTAVDTGTEPFPTVAQSAAAVAMTNVGNAIAANTPWFVIATQKFVIFSLGNAVTPSSAIGTLEFGDLADPVVAGDVYSSMLRSTAGFFGDRSYTGAAGAILLLMRDSDGSSATVWPSVIADGARFLPYVPVLESGTHILRGVVPCAYKSYPHVPANRFLEIYSNITGISGRLKPVAALSGQAMSMAIAIDEDVWD